MMGLFTYLFFMLVSERTLCPSGFPARSTNTNKDHRPACAHEYRCRPVFPLTAKGDGDGTSRSRKSWRPHIMQLYMQRWHGQEKRSNRSRTLIFLILDTPDYKTATQNFHFSSASKVTTPHGAGTVPCPQLTRNSKVERKNLASRSFWHWLCTRCRHTITLPSTGLRFRGE